MTYYDYRKNNEAALRKLKKILKEPERRALEESFAADHADDTDEQLLEYVKEKKLQMRGGFNRSRLIGYQYIVERFGSWEKVMSSVNRAIDIEKGKEVQIE